MMTGGREMQSTGGQGLYMQLQRAGATWVCAVGVNNSKYAYPFSPSSSCLASKKAMQAWRACFCSIHMTRRALCLALRRHLCVCVRFRNSLAIFLRLTMCPNYRQSHISPKPRQGVVFRRTRQPTRRCLPPCLRHAAAAFYTTYTHGFRHKGHTNIYCASRASASHHIIAIYPQTGALWFARSDKTTTLTARQPPRACHHYHHHHHYE